MLQHSYSEMFIDTDVRLWNEAKDIEIAFNTILAYCSLGQDRNKHALPTAFDRLYSQILTARENFIGRAAELSCENEIGYSNQQHELRFMNDRSKQRLKYCQSVLHDISDALSSVGSSQKSPMKSLFGTTRTDDFQIEDISRKFKPVNIELHDILSDLSIIAKNGNSTKDNRSIFGGYDYASKGNQNAILLQDRHTTIDLVDIVRNSWYEKLIEGRQVFVNCMDSEHIRLEEPKNSYIKRLSFSFDDMQGGQGSSISKSIDSGLRTRLGETRASLGASRSKINERADLLSPKIPSTSLGLLQSSHSKEGSGLDTDYQEDVEARARRAAWEEVLKSAAEQKFKAGLARSYEEARKMVELESVMWSQRYYNGRCFVDIPRQFRVKDDA